MGKWIQYHLRNCLDSQFMIIVYFMIIDLLPLESFSFKDFKHMNVTVFIEDILLLPEYASNPVGHYYYRYYLNRILYLYLITCMLCNQGGYSYLHSFWIRPQRIDYSSS